VREIRDAMCGGIDAIARGPLASYKPPTLVQAISCWATADWR
jgi:hypothetical protein